MINNLLTTASILLLIFPSVATSNAKEEGKEKPLSSEEMAKLLELTKPGPEHELLKEFSGNWTVSISGGRGGKAAASTGGGRSYMTLEGRFLWIGYGAKGRSGNYKGSFQIGFDRRHGRFDLIAMDNFGTYFVTSHGKMDAETKKAKLYGEDDDPYMKAMGLDKEFIHELDFSNPDKFTITVYFIDTRTPERKEEKAMVFSFERKADKEAEKE